MKLSGMLARLGTEPDEALAILQDAHHRVLRQALLNRQALEAQIALAGVGRQGQREQQEEGETKQAATGSPGRTWHGHPIDLRCNQSTRGLCCREII
jgi:hypothetical protein